MKNKKGKIIFIICIAIAILVLITILFFYNNLYIMLSENSKSNKEINYSFIGDSSENRDGIYMVEETKNKLFPIKYFFGEVYNNNIIFANYCWKIVRTTEKGGVKILYNGAPNENNHCNSRGEDVIIGKSFFNKDENFGYMRGESYETKKYFFDYANYFDEKNSDVIFEIEEKNYIYSDKVTYDDKTSTYTLVNGKTLNESVNARFKYTCFSDKDTSCKTVYYIYGAHKEGFADYIPMENGKIAIDPSTIEIVFSQDVVYDKKTKEYVLITPKKIKLVDWYNRYSIINEEYRYTCFSDKKKCQEVNFIDSLGFDYISTTGPTLYYYSLKNGKTKEYIYEELYQNSKKDSDIKKMLDSWYEENLIKYEKFLEDSIWCNDRSNNIESDENTLSTVERLKNEEFSFSCEKADSFTVSDKRNGNGLLKYPIGLLTSDEIFASGIGPLNQQEDHFLNSGVDFWTMSPAGKSSMYYFSDMENKVFNDIKTMGYDKLGVRPAVTLKFGVKFSSGDGSKENPYIVK